MEAESALSLKSPSRLDDVAVEGRRRKAVISSQLGRTVLARSALSADEQEAVPDERGSYGELIDLLDDLLRRDQAEERR